MWIFSTTKRHLPFGCSCFKSQREKSKTIAPMASIAGLLRFQNPNGKIYCGNSMYKIPQAEQMFQIPTGKVKTFSCWSLNIKFSVFQIPMGKVKIKSILAYNIPYSTFQIPKGISNTKIANKFARKSASFKFQRKK